MVTVIHVYVDMNWMLYRWDSAKLFHSHSSKTAFQWQWHSGSICAL